jgi:ABC-type lipoprotein release transport system permease subunit
VTSEITVAILGLIGTLAGSFLGVVAAGKLTQYRLQQLEDKVNKHNNLIERTFILEGRMTEAEHDIRDLKTR